jgi:hypothetical protein
MKIDFCTQKLVAIPSTVVVYIFEKKINIDSLFGTVSENIQPKWRVIKCLEGEHGARILLAEVAAADFSVPKINIERDIITNNSILKCFAKHFVCISADGQRIRCFASKLARSRTIESNYHNNGPNYRSLAGQDIN